MAANYTGNSAGVSNFETSAIVLSEPADADAITAASINTALSKIADYLNYVQKIAHGDISISKLQATEVDVSGPTNLTGDLTSNGHILSKDTPLIRVAFTGTTINDQRWQTGAPNFTGITNGSPGIVELTLSSAIQASSYLELTRGAVGASGVLICAAFVFDTTHVRVLTWSTSGTPTGIASGDQFFLSVYKW